MREVFLLGTAILVKPYLRTGTGGPRLIEPALIVAILGAGQRAEAQNPRLTYGSRQPVRATMIGRRRSTARVTRSMRRLGRAGFRKRGLGSTATKRTASWRVSSAALLWK